MNKLKSYHLLYIIFTLALLYYPIKIAKYYLMDLSYDEILDIVWRGDGCNKDDYPNYKDKECPCGGGLLEPGDSTINKDGLMFMDDKIIGKVTLKKKPSFFSMAEILTGGELEIQDLDTGIICYYDSVLD